MEAINTNDGCAPAICPSHGVLLRVIVGAEVFCQGCGRWYRTIPDEGRRKLKLRRTRNQRYYKSRQPQATEASTA